MKIRHLFFSLFVAAAVFGCASKKTPPPEAPTANPPPPPEEALTPATLERLRKMPDFNISNYQFVLSGQITLNIVKTISNDRSSGGQVIFENVHVRSRITFPDKSPGQALDVETGGDKFVLRVCFEHQEDDAIFPPKTYFLTFSARKSEENAYFYLEYNDPRPDTRSEEKGNLRYGQETYALLFNEDKPPYLLIRLEQRSIESEEIRRARGRSVNPN